MEGQTVTPKYGQTVEVSQEYVREKSRNYANWVTKDLEAKVAGIFLGTRCLREGFIEHSHDEGSIFTPIVFKRVALVSLSAKRNPAYVPLGAVCVVTA